MKKYYLPTVLCVRKLWTNTFFFLWRYGPKRAMTSSLLRLLDHTQRRTTVSKTSLDQWSARCRGLCLTEHNTRKRQTSMFPAVLKAIISGGVQPQTQAIDRSVTGIGRQILILVVIARMIIKLARCIGIATRREVTAYKTLVTEILLFMLWRINFTVSPYILIH